MESRAGRGIFEDIGTRLHQEGRNRLLALKTLREFDDRPSGLYLPHGQTTKRVETERIERVLWKLVRGTETGINLPLALARLAAA